MGDRPILFQGAMVRALLAGTKTQTRRAMRVQPGDETTVHVEHFNQTVIDRHGDEQPGPEIFGAWWDDGESGAKCQYGGPGDRLWVRETFFAFGRWETRFNPKKGRDEWHFIDMTVECGHWYFYAATSEPSSVGSFRRRSVTPMWWKRPAIHMPRAASRTLLEITAVRVERLQEISEADAVAEGLTFSAQARRSESCMGIYECRMPDGLTHFDASAVSLYRTLWEQINGAGSWDANPWVWVVEFKQVENGHA